MTLKRLFIHTALALLLSLGLALGGCRSSRHTTSTAPQPQGGATATPDAEGITWSTLRLPVKARVSQPASVSLGGTLAMVRGRSADLSLRMLGFEVAAVHASPDSVWAYAKLQRVYVAESIDRALGGLGVSLADVQDMLLGTPLHRPPALTADGRVQLTPLAATGQPLRLAVDAPPSRRAQIDYTPLDGVPVAAVLSLQATVGQRSLQASLDYDWAKAQVDAPLQDKPFKIPSGYRRIDLASLLRSLGQ